MIFFLEKLKYTVPRKRAETSHELLDVSWFCFEVFAHSLKQEEAPSRCLISEAKLNFACEEVVW